MGRRSLGLLVVALLVTGACSSGSESAPTPTPVVLPRHAPELSGAPTDWPLPNFDHANSRSVTSSAITRATVGGLAEKWRVPLPRGGPFGAAATTPIVLGDTVYLGDLKSNVHAFDLATGARRWSIDEDRLVFGPSGVVVGWGHVFSNRGGEEIVAYDLDSREERWARSLVAAGGAVNIQPTLGPGVVLAATSSLNQPGGRGRLFALDPASGEVVWSFDTIESPDLWGHPEINSGGGAWYPPAVDADAGVSYWGTSNPYPQPGAPGWPNGSSRPGDNRWTNSILAVALEGGALRWGHQAVPHDVFDLDTVLTAIVERDDRRQVIISTGKLGRVIGLDPDGTVLWDTPVGRHENDDLTEFEGRLDVMPGSAGGVETPIAVADGIVYVAAVNGPIEYEGPEQASDGGHVRLGTFPSNLVAIDSADGSVLWDVEVDGDAFGAMTVVNDLVFTSLLDGRILALDRATGETVFTHQAPGGINAWPAVSGDTIVVPVGYGDPPVLLALGL